MKLLLKPLTRNIFGKVENPVWDLRLLSLANPTHGKAGKTPRWLPRNWVTTSVTCAHCTTNMDTTLCSTGTLAKAVFIAA